MKSKKNPKNKLHSRRSLLPDNSRVNVDSKLTQAAIVLEYAFIHHVNFKERIIRLTGEVDADMFNLVDSAMTELESQGRKTVTIRINSPGGDVYHALAIIGRLKSSSCNIVTEGYGEIASASTIILACGDRRRVSRFTFFMHHEASMTLEGRQSQIDNDLKQAKLESDKWSEWMAEFSKKKKDFWVKSGVHVDAYLSPEQLLEFGVVDEVF